MLSGSAYLERQYHGCESVWGDQLLTSGLTRKQRTRQEVAKIIINLIIINQGPISFNSLQLPKLLQHPKAGPPPGDKHEPLMISQRLTMAKVLGCL